MKDEVNLRKPRKRSRDVVLDDRQPSVVDRPSEIRNRSRREIVKDHDLGPFIRIEYALDQVASYEPCSPSDENAFGTRAPPPKIHTEWDWRYLFFGRRTEPAPEIH